ncbi:MAG: lipopolysaccharide biosynthesis protein [Candidatus Electronema sp. V4]|uniref:lipopolysaccharide biosynthesis protein n=1 Tax=Candidatus Electronema sp. V4 TaxID=3454756 RepID=UPI004055783E
MTLLKKNIIANFGGNIWTGLMSLVFVPLYIRFMGIEAYGLMGLFAALMGLFALLDMGLSTTLNREMARLSVQQDKAQDMRDLLRTLEIPYWLVAVLIAVIVMMASPFIAYHWVKAKDLSPDSVRNAVMLMGLCAAFQWPTSFYSGGLMGLQRQVLLNGINVAMATFRGAGAVLILWLISPTVEAFFFWQLAVSAVHIGLIVFFMWRSLPAAAARPRFRRELLRTIWRFAAGMTGITITVIFLMQLDKIILSRMLSLEMFGYYTFANVVAMTLYRFISPVFSAAYPKLTCLVEQGAEEEITKLYHQSAQLVSVLVLPAALVVAFFSKELLLLWTQSPATADNAHLLVTILVLGTACNGLMNIPYTLQLAYGWTRFAFTVNIVSVLLLVPLMIVLATRYGAVGAASVWLLLNAGYIFTSLPLMHRRLLPTEKWQWYFEDVGRPLFAAAVVCLIGRLVVQADWPTLPIVAGIGVTSAIALLAAAFSANRLDTAARIRTAVNALLQPEKKIHAV